MAPSPIEPENEPRDSFWVRVHLSLTTLVFGLFANSLVRPRFSNAVSFAIIGSEGAQLWLSLQALLLRYLYRRNPSVVVGEWFGRCLLSLNLASAFVLARNIWQGWNVPRSLSDQLIQQGGIRPTRIGSLWLSLILPILYVSRRGVPLKSLRNIPYADLANIDPKLHENSKRAPSRQRDVMMIYRGRISQWLSCDVLRPCHAPTSAALRPVVLAFHGGGWCVGDKMYGTRALLTRLASYNMVVVCANYRMSPEVRFPAHIIDCKRALLFVKRHCQDWGGDPRKIFVLGDSAGGHLAALMGTTVNYRPFDPPELEPSDTSIAGCLPIYGVFDWSDSSGHLKSIREWILGVPADVHSLVSTTVLQTRYRKETKHQFDQASPTFYVKQNIARDIPPFAISHGTLDSLTPYGGSKEFMDELKAYRRSHQSPVQDVFLQVQGGVHGFGYMPSLRTHAVADAFADFIEHHARQLDKSKL